MTNYYCYYNYYSINDSHCLRYEYERIFYPYISWHAHTHTQTMDILWKRIRCCLFVSLYIKFYLFIQQNYATPFDGESECLFIDGMPYAFYHLQKVRIGNDICIYLYLSEWLRPKKRETKKN